MFLVARMREARVAGLGERDAIATGLSHTGGLITSAAAIMVVVFGAFMLGDFLLMKMLGFALAVAVLLDATVMRLGGESGAADAGGAVELVAGRKNRCRGAQQGREGNFAVSPHHSLVVAAIAQRASQSAAHAPALDGTTADKQARNLTLQVGTILDGLVVFVRFLSGFGARLQQVRQDSTADAPPSQHAATNHQAYEPAFSISSVLVALLVALLGFLVATRALPDEVGEQGTTHASPAQQAAADKQACELAIVLAGLFVALVGVLSLTALHHQLRLEQAAQAPSLQQFASDQSLHQLAFLVVAGAVVAIVSDVRVHLVLALAILIQKTRDQRTADASIALTFPAKRDARKIFGFWGCVHVISRCDEKVNGQYGWDQVLDESINVFMIARFRTPDSLSCLTALRSINGASN